ncbi:MAG: acyl-CoA thioesterase [Rhodospirillales bacterium]|nr:acyl-CoA thioesterase [Rhodospirillales bacterium]QQS13122.1 MAG: acyl-CoA thioesterase [Rhodospirillales bacterium]
MIVATRRIEIEWGHCDPAGIVFNPRFFEWFDACTAGLFAHVGLRKHEMIARFAFTGFPIVESRAKFLKPAKFGDIVVIESSVLEFRRSSFDVRHQLKNDGALSVEAFETRVWVGPHPDEPGRLKSQPIPEEVLARFRDG